jgi:tetratricopeptide (TPR) repeat protein
MTTALNNMGHVAILRGEHESAREIFSENISTYRDLGDIGGIAMTLENLGPTACRQGDYQRAAELYRAALDEAGTSLPSISLSVLVRISELFLMRKQNALVNLILATVLHHPASNQELRERVRLLLADSDLSLPADEPIVSLEELTKKVVQLSDFITCETDQG